MRILVTNDDGIRAPGIQALTRVAQRYGEVAVVAPDHEKSACGHALTMREPLRAREFEWPGARAWEVNGVPTDCVNLGRYLAFPDGCDLILSGINNGPNLGFDVTYSGTVAGAMEGCMNGIRSIAISMAGFVHGAPIHYETGEDWLGENMPLLLDLPLEHLTFINVNIPAVAAPEIRGHRFTSMGQRVYSDRIESRLDPYGRPYYWQGGMIEGCAMDPGTDVLAASEGFVSISPISLDWTRPSLLATWQDSAVCQS